MSAAPQSPEERLRALAPIVAEFLLGGELVSAAPHAGGHINETHVLTVRDAAGRMRRLVLQRINHGVFRDVPALMENMSRVCAHLAARSPRALRLVPARDGRSFARGPDGSWWRLCEFIEGTITVERIRTEAQAREAARAFGEFQAQLADLPGPPLRETVPNFHHTRGRFEALRAAIAADVCNRAAAARAEIAFALAREADTDVLHALHARGGLRAGVVHNDAKIANLLLDAATGRAAAVIDLDTVMPGLAVHDFGELVRTGASSTVEDDPDPARMHVRPELFRALAAGWLESTGVAGPAAERAHLAFAGKMMAYENGIRFLADFLQGDTYYRVADPGHNLRRCRAQFALVRSIEHEQAALDRIVADLFGSP